MCTRENVMPMICRHDDLRDGEDYPIGVVGKSVEESREQLTHSHTHFSFVCLSRGMRPLRAHFNVYHMNGRLTEGENDGV